MVVNGVIWPREDVEPRNYRLHLLNGTDSRFMALQLFEVPAGATNITAAIKQLSFDVIGSDQGLASSPTTTNMLLSEPGSRYDIIVDFKQVSPGNRVIMWNIGGDEPFGGDIGVGQIFEYTDRVMAFDVVVPDSGVADATPSGINFPSTIPEPTRTRQVALFEGKDEYGRLQPLLGTAEPATDYLGNPIYWQHGPLAGQQMEGSIAWHSATTENPALGSTEEWVVWNVTGDGHPVHLHLVHFEVLGREDIVWDSATNEDDRVLDPDGVTAPAPAGDGTYLVTQPVLQHNGLEGMGFKIVNQTTSGVPLPTPEGVVENSPKDMVTALPGQITRIKATFDKPGRYVWHCHILSHEDHEMMRVLHVGPGA
jgi:FtsP/CotA-like multicopper oxidase with cupredoxin domain